MNKFGKTLIYSDNKSVLQAINKPKLDATKGIFEVIHNIQNLSRENKSI